MERQPENGYLETAQVCNLLGIHRSTLWRLVREGRLRQYTVPWSKHPRYRAEEVRALKEHPPLDEAATVGQWAEAALEAVWLLDVEGRIRYANPAAARALGCAIQQLLGEPLTSFITSESLTRALAALEQALGGRASPLRPLALRQPLTEPSHWDTTFSPVLRDGAPAGVLVQAREMGGQWALEPGAGLLLQALELGAVGLLVTDAAGVVQYGNAAAAALLGVAPEQLADERLEKWWSPANPIGTADAIHRGALSGGWDGELLLRPADGGPDRWARLRLDVAREGARVVALVGVLEEWSRQRERQQNELKSAQLQGAVQALQALERSLGEPLQALEGNLRLLRMALGSVEGLAAQGLQGALDASQALAAVCQGLWGLAGLSEEPPAEAEGGRGSDGRPGALKRRRP